MPFTTQSERFRRATTVSARIVPRSRFLTLGVILLSAAGSALCRFREACFGAATPPSGGVALVRERTTFAGVVGRNATGTSLNREATAFPATSTPVRAGAILERHGVGKFGSTVAALAGLGIERCREAALSVQNRIDAATNFLRERNAGPAVIEMNTSAAKLTRERVSQCGALIDLRNAGHLECQKLPAAASVTPSAAGGTLYNESYAVDHTSDNFTDSGGDPFVLYSPAP